jgi:hypothetical protein
MDIYRKIRQAQAEEVLIRQAQEAKPTDWVPAKHKREAPQTGDPHPQGGVYIRRNSVQGLLDALPYLLNDGIRLGRIKKLGRPDPGQKWAVEVYKPGTNSPTQGDDGEWTYNPQGGVPGAIIVHVEGDQLTWTGDAFSSFDEALRSFQGAL